MSISGVIINTIQGDEIINVYSEEFWGKGRVICKNIMMNNRIIASLPPECIIIQT